MPDAVPASSFTVERDMPAAMRDGTVLRADVFTPEGAGPWPVLVCRTPYGKFQPRYQETAARLAARGYLAVVQDIRGRYASDGEWVNCFSDNSGTFDAEDGYDTIEWAAGLPGCDGQAGTWGHSYPSWCIWRLAPTQPPHLKALFASGMSARLLDLTFGIFETGRRLQWTYQMAADLRRREGKDDGPLTPEEADTRWLEVERGKWVWFLPLDKLPDYVFSTETPKLKQYLREQNVEYWHFDKIHQDVTVPTCVVTGWWDRLIGTIDNHTGMVANGPAQWRKEHRLVVGPWGHNATNFTRHQGPLDLGPEADAIYADLIARWYDHRLKGLPNGMADEPPVKLFILGENRWRFENEWPLARTRYTEFFLHSGGSANTPAGDGTLSAEAPGQEPADHYDYDPADPLMSMMGLDAQAAPRDQAPLQGRQDLLVYQTPPLTQPLELVGPVELKLWVASDAPDTDFAAKLCVVDQAGMAVNLTYGILRCRYREGYEQEVFLKPGEPVELTLRLNPVGIRFQPGQRLRLDIASSDFPNFDRNHNTGKDFWDDTELRVARNTVLHDAAHPSHLVLPVIPLP